MRYYLIQEFGMVMPDQVPLFRRQDGVVGWRYREEKHILDLLFDTDVQDEQGRLEAIASGMKVYLMLDGQREAFHLPTHLSILEEIADAVDGLLQDAVGLDENAFNPSEYVVGADELMALSALMKKLEDFDGRERMG